jgi:hypothetical protein
METTRRDTTTGRPPRPNFPNAQMHGDGSLVFGLLALMSPFVTARIFEHAPLWVFVVGVILCIASVWLAALAVRAPGGSRGRGTAAAGIVLAILGFALCLFAWVIASTMLNDSLL